MNIQLTAGIEIPVNKVANNIRITEATGKIQVTIEGFQQDGISTYNETLTLQKGMAYVPPLEFKRIRLLSETTQDVQIELTKGKLDDNRLAGYVSTNETGGNGNGLQMITFDTQAKKIASNGDRKHIILKADKDNTDDILLYATADGYGLPLDAGESITLQTDDAIDLFVNVTGQKLWATEVIVNA